ncbi:MAG: phosphoenolpyruvate--protein phosphotransferase [Parachlamydia sp.]|nr:phosphoenolpyruvate--protein phosphotransferase [Parachlamydia sp.]
MKIQVQDYLRRGVPICRGIAIGKPFIFNLVEDDIPEFTIAVDDLDAEIHRYRTALEKAKEELAQLKKQLEHDHILEGAAILDAQQQMMLDPLLNSDVEQKIHKTRRNAESVFQDVIKQYQKRFSAMTDPFFRERFKDIHDISRRVMSHLLETVRFSLADIPENSIIFAREFSPSDIAEANNAHAGALVAEAGCTMSHAAIVAKAKGIPYVANVNFSSMELDEDTLVIVDGRTGEVIINPSPETLHHYQQLYVKLNTHLHALRRAGNLEAETYDGYKVRLSANIDMLNEAEMLHQYGSSGVGLFRSEYIFLANERFPSEEEQFHIYRRVVEKMRGLPIVIRTFDVGGDKVINDRKMPHETNPYLGCRAIRFLLKEKEIFKAQLRAILRASAYGDVSIMFPMVSALPELLEAKSLIKQAQEELRDSGEPIATHVRIGCMIEVPSAAIISDLLAKECDFLSIGTNDLVQYALAVDRDNHTLSGLYSATHPGVIRLIKHIVAEANQQGIPVTVCGEVAADPRFTPLLLGLGVHELSVASRYLPIIKNAIRYTSIVAASTLAETILKLPTALEIEELLNQEYKQNVPEDCFYNC